MSATTTELWRMSATDLAEAIRSRKTSSQEVIEAHLRRIEAVNPSINAVTVLLGEQALEAAKAADRALVVGGDLPPFHGVPFTVKGNIDVAGTPTTLGLKVLAGAYPALDAHAVERLKAAGAIPMGRTNLPNLAVRWHCESELWGATVNPWDRSRTPGASSGGEAAALATGMTSLGPRQRWARIASLAGPMLRHKHAEAHPWSDPGCDHLRARAGRDRHPADGRRRTDGAAGCRPPSRLRGDGGAHLARPVDGARPASRPRTRQADPSGACRRPGRPRHRATGAGRRPEGRQSSARRRLCHRRGRAAVDRRRGEDLAGHAQHSRHAGGVADAVTLLPADTRRFMSAFFQVADDPDPVQALQSFVTRRSLLRAWGEFQATHPLIVAPIFTDVPFAAGTDLDDGRVAETIRGMRMAIAVNALGLPAVALPVGIGDGLPQSVQLIGPRYREDLCLDAAAALEDRVGVITPIDPR